MGLQVVYSMLEGIDFDGVTHRDWVYLIVDSYRNVGIILEQI